MSPRDSALITRWVEARDADAFAELVALYQDMVYTAASRVLRNNTEAADIAQECFVRLALKPPKSSEYLGGWLHRVVTNLAIDARRRSMRTTELERRFTQEMPRAADAVPDDVQHFIDEAIDALPAPTRDMVIAHYLEGRGHAEIAVDFGVSKQAVTRRISKGVESVRQTLTRAGVTLSAAGLISFLTANVTKAAPVALALAIVRALSSARVTIPASKAAPLASAGLSKLFAAIATAAAAVTIVVFMAGNRDSEAARDRQTATPSPQPKADEVIPAQVSESVPTTPKLLVAQADSSAQAVGWSGQVRDSQTGETIRGIPVEIRRRDAIRHTLTKTDKAPNLSGSDLVNVNSIIKDVVTTDENRIKLPEYIYALDLKLDMGPPLMTLTSDESGAVEVSGLSPGEYIATVNTPKYATTGRAPFPVEGQGVARVEVGSLFTVAPGATSVVSVVVQQKAEVTGRVYDYRTNAGVSGVTIQVRQTTPNHPIVNVPMGETTTDSAGKFVLNGLRPGECLLWRSDVTGYVGGIALVKRVQLTPGSTTQGADFVLSSGGLLAGTVLIGGEPAKNTPFDLLVVAADQDIRKNTSITERFVETPVTTDGNGQFYVAGTKKIDAGVVGQIRLSSGQTYHSKVVRIASAKDAYNEIKVEFPWGPGVIKGKVTSDAGRPLSGTTVIKYVGNDNLSGRSQIATNADGAFRFDGVEKGSGRIVVYYPDSYDSVSFPLEYEEREVNVEFSIPSNAVNVVFENVPADMVRMNVTAREAGWKPDYGTNFRDAKTKDWRSTIANSRYFPTLGRSRLYGLSPGTYTLVAASHPCDPEAWRYYDDEQLDRYLHQARIIIQPLTVTAADPNPTVHMDFANAISLFEATQGATK